MTGEEEAARCRAAERALRDHGLPQARVRAVGPDLEIAAVQLPGGPDPAALERLTQVEEKIRTIGFRYVTLDLEIQDA